MKAQTVCLLKERRPESSRKPSQGDVVLEMQVFEGEMCLHDPGGLDPSPQHILLRGDVVCLGYPLQIVQIAEEHRNTVNEATHPA